MGRTRRQGSTSSTFKNVASRSKALITVVYVKASVRRSSTSGLAISRHPALIARGARYAPHTPHTAHYTRTAQHKDLILRSTMWVGAVVPGRSPSHLGGSAELPNTRATPTNAPASVRSSGFPAVAEEEVVLRVELLPNEPKECKPTLEWKVVRLKSSMASGLSR